jgi:hypothetical protein
MTCKDVTCSYCSLTHSRHEIQACGCVVEKHFVHRQVSYYDYALDLILDADTPSAEILTDEQHELVESAAETLYGLIHVRCAQTCRCLL